MIRRFLHFIRFSHTIFALPFAVGAMFVAAAGRPSLRIAGLILLAMVFARTAAMTFNRLADWEIDKRNPRTEGRHKLVPKPVAVFACAASALLFWAVTWWINPLCFALAPVALLIVFAYSYAKRFTSLAQFFLGLALSVAPVGAWVAVTGHFAAAPFILAAGVLVWTAGFDTIYATQDYEVDRREGLRSLVVWLGVPLALRTAILLHLAALAAFIAFGIMTGLGFFYFLTIAFMTAALVYEHLLVRKGNVRAINQAFFQANAIVGLLFVIGTIVATTGA